MRLDRYLTTAVVVSAMSTLSACTEQPSENLSDAGDSQQINPAATVAAAWNENSIDSLAPLLANGMVLHGPRPGGSAGFAGNRNGKAAFLIHLKQLREVLGDDAGVAIRNVVQDGERVAVTYEFSGVHAGPYFGVGPTGQPVTIIVQDTFVLRDGQIVEAWHVPDRFSMIETVSVFPGTARSYQRIAAETVAAFDPGAFPESVVQHPNGDFFVTLQMDGQIWRVSNNGASLFAQLPAEALAARLDGPTTLNVDADGRVVAAVMSANPEFQGVWAFDVPSGNSRKLAALPSLNNHLNGSAIDDRGRIFVADSTLGIIWQVDSDAGQGDVWLKDPILAPRPYVGLAPGANGLRFFQGALYVSVPDKKTIVRIPVLEDGQPGVPTVHVNGLAGDDFAIDDDGTMYVTTHIQNSIVQVAPDGTVLGDIATEQDGIIGSTAAIVAHDGNGEKWLYVTNDGGLLGPPRAELMPNLSRLPLQDDEQ